MEITAIILAGGQGRRFGYQDKGLIPWRGQPLVKHVIEAIRPQVSDIIISCNQNTEDYAQWGYAIIQDETSEFNGPLAGISAALEHCSSGYALIVPCDCPLLPSDLVARLSKPFSGGKTGALTPQASIVFDGKRSQYLCALLDCRVLPGLHEFLKLERLAVKDWYSTLSSIDIDFSDQAQAFRNINTPEDLKSLG